MPQLNNFREFRSLKVGELRADKTEDGKRYLSGYAATYNTLSGDLGWGMRERILPGAFARALREKQDVKHLINHDPNFVLGRTTSGTTDLSEDSKGLKFRTLVNEDDPFATSLFSKVQRGDINECSFGFIAKRTSWIEEPDPENPDYPRDVRQLEDVDLFDVSTVTYPAYPNTNTQAERSLFPDGVPAEIRSKIKPEHRASTNADCACKCAECMDGDCEECSNDSCDDKNCRCADERSRVPKPPIKTKRVDGEDLRSDCFLIVGDPLETKSWKIPVKFATPEKTAAHLRNNLNRFNDLKDVSDEVRPAAWLKLIGLCVAQGVDASDPALRSRLTAEQIYDFEKDQLLTDAAAKVRAIQASL